MTKHERLRIRSKRAAIAVLAVLALLFQSAFVIACDVHDLAHVVSSVAGDDDIGCKDALDEQAEPAPSIPDEGRWHDVFAVGHCMVQTLQSTSLHSLFEVQPITADLPAFVDQRLRSAPGNLLLRPPIDA